MHPDEVGPKKRKRKRAGKDQLEKKRNENRSIIPFFVQLVNKPIFVFGARAPTAAVRGQLVVALAAGNEAGAG